MTREEALALDRPLPRLSSRCATGTDGERWYCTFAMGRQEWTQELFWTSWGVCGRDQDELDPAGVDWVPGYYPPDPEQLASYPNCPPRQWEQGVGG